MPWHSEGWLPRRGSPQTLKMPAGTPPEQHPPHPHGSESTIWQGCKPILDEVKFALQNGLISPLTSMRSAYYTDFFRCHFIPRYMTTAAPVGSFGLTNWRQREISAYPV